MIMPVAATVFLSESNGAGPTVTDNVSNINLGGVDLPNIVPANHPVVRPDTVTQFFSYFKSLRIKIQSLGDSLQIQDLRLWKTSGAYVVGEGTKLALNSGSNTYHQPNQTSVALAPNSFTEVADPMPSADPGIDYLYTKAASHAAITILDGIPFYCPYIFLQWYGNFGATTPIGSVNQKTIAFTYAES